MSAPLGTVAVVGASLAGLYTARALRAEGYAGRLVLIGEEPHGPYDRPPLSKDFLTGKSSADDLALTDAEELAELDAEWLLGVRATGLDASGGSVRLADGRSVAADGVVVATGARARRLPFAGVYTLRTLDDAVALREALSAGPAHVVVIGGGFIGAEVASSCQSLGHDVTVVEAAPLPLIPQLGEELAEVCAGLHADHGVRLITGTGVAEVGPSQVVLTDGQILPADIVIAGIGAVPNTEWLEGSPLAVDNGVLCDAGCVTTSLPNVVAVGDVARVDGVRAEHWTSATEQAGTAARNLLAGRTVETHRPVPYFWSDQYGVRLQFAGHRAPDAAVTIAEGSPADRSFLAHYTRNGTPTAVLSLNLPRPFMRARRELVRARAAV